MYNSLSTTDNSEKIRIIKIQQSTIQKTGQNKITKSMIQSHTHTGMHTHINTLTLSLARVWLAIIITHANHAFV